MDIDFEKTTILNATKGENVRDALIDAIKAIADGGITDKLKGNEAHPDDISVDDLVYLEDAKKNNLSILENPSEDSDKLNRPVSSGWYYHKMYGTAQDYSNSIEELYITLIEALSGVEEYTYGIDKDSYLGYVVDIITSMHDIADTITQKDTAQPVVVIFGETPASIYADSIRKLFHYTPETFTITENGTYKVSDYAVGEIRPVWSSVDVNVPPFAPQELEVKANGTYTTGYRTPYTVVHVKVPYKLMELILNGNTGTIEVGYLEKKGVVMIPNDKWSDIAH